MERGATITFLSAIASLIIFSSFITIFPEGINIASSPKMEYKGDLVFYGMAEGNASELFANNFSISVNGKNFSGDNLHIKGSMHFLCPQALFNGTIFSNETNFECHDCQSNVEEIYEGGIIKGEIVIKPVGKVLLKKSKIEMVTGPFLFPLKIDKVGFAREGKLYVNGEKINFSDYIFFRGEGVYITKEKKFQGNVNTLVIDGRFYEKEKKFLFIPYKIFILWIAAIAIFFISLFLKKDVYKEVDKKRIIDKDLLGFSIIISILFFALSFFLWNCEIERIFGMNIFDITSLEIKSILLLSFEIIPYMVAVAIIGFPAKVMVSSIFEVFGLTNIGKGVGRSVGFILSFIWGISLLPVLLNLTLAPLLKFLPSILG